jgi:hypothetical protein
VVPNEDGTHLTTTNFAHNTHGSIEQINGQWYVFYHRPPRGFANARQAMVAPVKITWDKKKVADGGKVRIVAYDPYAKNQEWTAKATDGAEYTGAEVTSEGFHIFGLPPYAYYSAGYACYVTGYQWMQDNHDVWNNHMDLAGITNRGIVGFKYFGFGGLDHDSKGIHAFAGTREGDGTLLCVNLTPSGHGAFKVRVMLDGPYANDTWKGREIAVIDVPADAPRVASTYSVAVPAVEGLKGKHAIYLVAEGPEVQQPQQRQQWGGRPSQPERPVGLFDLHGIGFSKSGTLCERPVVPQVTILADGQKLAIPSTPIRSSNANGYTDATRYQIYAPLAECSKLTATATHPDVNIFISPIVKGRATITCTYQGNTKIYLITSPVRIPFLRLLCFAEQGVQVYTSLFG